MNLTTIRNRLLAAQREWRRAGQSRDCSTASGYIPGVIDGLRIARQMIEELNVEEHSNLSPTARRLDRWFARELLDASITVRQHLEDGRADIALKILHDVIQKVSASRSS